MTGSVHQVSSLRLLGTDDVGADGLVDPDETPTPADRPSDGELVRLITLLLGAIGLALDALGTVVREVGLSVPGDGEENQPAGLLRLVASAGMGLTAEAVRRAAGFTDRAVSAAVPLARFAADHTPLGAPLGAGRRWLEGQGERAYEEQQERQRVTSGLIDALIPRIAAAVVERIDLDGIVRNVDIAAVVDRVEVNEIVAKVDIDRIVGRLDIDAIASRIDLNAIAARIDVNAIAARIDVQAIIDQVDLPTITKQVMDEVDVGEIIRESTGSITSETVDAIRYQGMNADRLVARVVDRVLFRKGDRETAIALPPSEPPAHAAAPAADPDTTPA